MPDMASTMGAKARRVDGGDVGVAEAEARHRARLGVLGDDVEPRGHLQDEFPAARVLEVDADAALAEVVAQEGGADPPAFGVGHRGKGAASGVSGRGLDLDDLGAEAGQELGRVGECLHLFQCQDADAVQGPGSTLSHGRSLIAD
jgi:hypothetical protein